MAKRITIDPVTRIEGHLRIDCEVDNGKVSSCLPSVSAGSERQSTHWLQCDQLKMHSAWKFLKMPSTSEI
jgi:hypothetical protein